jgi:nucleotide-binding universal stress UspA family protein
LPPGRILAATDGRPTAESAVAVAQALARATGGECRVLCVETDRLPAGWRGPAPVLHGASPTATLWSRGVPAVEIVRRAESWKADLVVLGRGPRSAESPRALGPTSDAVVRRHTGATLFVPPGITEFRRMLIAVDGTPRGLGVLGGAAPFVQACVLHCHTICVLPAELPEDPHWSDPRRELIGQAVAGWTWLRERPVLHFRHGSPVRLIRQVAEEMRAEVLVLGVRRGGPSSDMGSGHIGRDLLSVIPAAILCIPI